MTAKRLISIFLFLACLTLACAIYYVAFNAGFQLDDKRIILENPYIKNPNYFYGLWQQDPSRFLTNLSFALNYHYGQLSSRGYHVTNVFIHVLVSFACFFFYRLILIFKAPSRPRSNITPVIIAATLIFLCHPIQTSAVTYIVQRSALLATLFYVLTLVFYLQSRIQGKKRYYFLAVISAAVGVFTKPIIITLPFMLVVCELFFLRPSKAKWHKTAIGLLPFFFILAVIPLLLVLLRFRTIDFSHVVDVTRETTRLTRREYLLTEFNVLVTYLRLLVLPVNQNFDYDYPIAQNFFVFPTYASFTILLLVAYTAFRIRKVRPVLSFCIFWFFITLSIESSIFPISDVIFEHRLYLPMVGFSLFLSLLIREFLKEARVYVLIIALLIGSYCWITYRRNQVWSSPIGLLEDTISKSPGKARVYNNLAVFYHDQGDLIDAMRNYRMAIMLDKNYAHPHNNLANLLRRFGFNKQSIEHYLEAMRIDPSYPYAYFNLANVYLEEGLLKSAEENYRKTLALNPDFANAYAGIGRVYFLKGDKALAKFYFKQAISINPDEGFPYLLLGNVYQSEGNMMSALLFYQESADRDQTMYSPLNKMGVIYDQMKDFSKAEASYREAIRRNPEFADAYFNLANTLVRSGRFEEAQEMLKRAKTLYQKEANTEMLQKTDQRIDQIRNLPDF